MRTRVNASTISAAFATAQPPNATRTTSLQRGALVRVLEDWCPPFPGFFLYYPSRRQQPAALSALIETVRV